MVNQTDAFFTQKETALLEESPVEPETDQLVASIAKYMDPAIMTAWKKQ